MFPDVVQHPLLNGFQMLGRLGAGAAGQVYLAKSRSGRQVAIKILREPKAGKKKRSAPWPARRRFACGSATQRSFRCGRSSRGMGSRRSSSTTWRGRRSRG